MKYSLRPMRVSRVWIIPFRLTVFDVPKWCRHPCYILYRAPPFYAFLLLHLLYWASIITHYCVLAAEVQRYIDEFNEAETILFLAHDDDMLDFLEEIDGVPL